jgi:quercetin 2,3-dioxygenase
MASRADLRPVRMIVSGFEQREGAGFLFRRPFPSRVVDHLDPFLLLDEMGPEDLAPGQAEGAPAHPHRGFETVTYLLAGELDHRDSRGHSGALRPGDVQWMTAGDGVVHSELPGEALRAHGGRMHGFQLWVNLPRAAKRTAPRYQDVRAADVPVAASDDGRAVVRVLAGDALGARAAVHTHTPILYLHVSLAPGGSLDQPVPSGWTAMAYVFQGRARVGREGRLVRTGQLVVLDDEGGVVALEADAETGPAEVLLLAGEPIREPIARYGPFVMNTQDELSEAVDDYHAGRMGELPGTPAQAPGG